MRTLHPRSFLQILIAYLFFAGPLCAQGTSPSPVGYYPYQTYSGTHEDINLGTGNLTVRVPIVKLPGRNGHNLDFAWTYNSQIWYQQSYQVLVGNPPNQSYQTQYYWNNQPPWTWGPPAGIASSGFPGILFNANQNVYNAGNQGSAPGSVWCDTNFRAVMPDGAVHTFGNVQAFCYQIVYGGGTGPAPTGYNFPIGDSLDSVPMHLDASTSNIIVYLPDGNRVSQNGFEDANGNEIASTNNALSLTDTLKRTLQGQGSNSSTPTSYTYVDSNGASRTITI